MGNPAEGARGAIVVLWTGYRAGPWTCRSLRAAGWSVIAVHPEGTGSGRSTACRSPRVVPSPLHAPDHLLATLRHICEQSGARAVLPVDEDCVRLLATREPDLGPARAIVPHPGAVGCPVR